MLFSSVDDLSKHLRATGYIADPVTISTVYLAGRLHRPLLIEGVAGSGKTQLAYALAAGQSTLIERLQCYPGIREIPMPSRTTRKSKREPLS